MANQKLDMLNELIDIHNQERTNRWLWKANPLEKNLHLMSMAGRWANKMAFEDNLQHSDMKQLLRSNSSFSSVAENIAYGQSDPKEVMKTWMNSKGHRNNILNIRLTQIGCGLAVAKSKIYWCVMFASLK